MGTAVVLANIRDIPPRGLLALGSFLTLLGGSMFIWGLHLEKKASKLKKDKPQATRTNPEIFATIVTAVGAAAAAVGGAFLLNAF